MNITGWIHKNLLLPKRKSTSYIEVRSYIIWFRVGGRYMYIDNIGGS